MADTKISALTAATSVLSTDILPVVTDPGGTPTSKKITVDNFQLSLSKVGKITVTQPATGATLTLADGSSLITVGAYAVTFTATGATGVTLPTSGTLTRTADKLSVFAATTSAELAGVISDETGSGGALVFASSPSITTPTIASFANSNHNHTNSAGGGLLTHAAITVMQCRAYHSTTQSITTSLTALAFDSESFDTDSMHTTGGSNTRITFTTAGYYLVYGFVITDANAIARAQIKLNGTTTIAKVAVGNAGASTQNGCVIMTTYSFSAADYVELMAAFGTTQNALGGLDGVHFGAVRIA
jgi:hypothetical protein